MSAQSFPVNKRTTFHVHFHVFPTALVACVCMHVFIYGYRFYGAKILRVANLLSFYDHNLLLLFARHHSVALNAQHCFLNIILIQRVVLNRSYLFLKQKQTI